MSTMLSQAAEGSCRELELEFEHSAWHPDKQLPHDPRRDNPGVIEWLLRQMDPLTLTRQAELCAMASRVRSIVLIHLAARSPAFCIPWDAATHSLAAAKADPAILKWLVAQPAADDFKIVHEKCTDGRLLLAHGHDWTLPISMQARFVTIQRRHLALCSVVRQARNSPGPDTNLGSLPDDVIKKISSQAGIDFSWRWPR